MQIQPEFSLRINPFEEIVQRFHKIFILDKLKISTSRWMAVMRFGIEFDEKKYFCRFAACQLLMTSWIFCTFVWWEIGKLLMRRHFYWVGCRLPELGIQVSRVGCWIKIIEIRPVTLQGETNLGPLNSKLTPLDSTAFVSKTLTCWRANNLK